MIKKLAPAFIALLALAPAAHAASTGANGRIVYQVDQSIQSMLASGKDRTRIAKGVADPSVSADGRRILYIADGGHTSGADDIWVMRADGSHRKQLTEGKPNDSDPAFSPDGRRIAFSRNGHLSLMDADGRNEHRLVRGRDYLYEPTFAPDGRTLVASGDGLISVRLADGAVTQLTDGHDISADLSPDGKRIVFSAYRDTTETTELYLAEADGSQVTRLTDDEHSDDSPVFSPDGTKIAFTHFTTSKLHGEDLDVKEEGARIRVMRIDGSGARNLRPGFGPSWASR